MIRIVNSKASINLSNAYYKTIINAKISDQMNETMEELGTPNEDEWSYEYELSDDILVILWK